MQIIMHSQLTNARQRISSETDYYSCYYDFSFPYLPLRGTNAKGYNELLVMCLDKTSFLLFTQSISPPLPHCLHRTSLYPCPAVCCCLSDPLPPLSR